MIHASRRGLLVSFKLLQRILRSRPFFQFFSLEIDIPVFLKILFIHKKSKIFVRKQIKKEYPNRIFRERQ